MDLMEARRLVLLDSPHIENSNSGIATFSTNLKGNLKSCKISLLPVQSGSGDPSPTNIRPISGWTGFNLNKTGRNIFDLNQATFTTGKYITDSGSIGSQSNYRYMNEYLRVKPNTTYTVRITKSANQATGFTVPFYNENKTFVERQVAISSSTSGLDLTGTFTTTATTRYIRFSCGTRVYNATLQIEEGNIAHTYESFGSLIQVSLGNNTIYGGALDVVTGVLTVTHISKILHKSNFGEEQNWQSVAIPYRNANGTDAEKPSSGTSWTKARETQMMNCGNIANPYSESSYGNYVGVVFYSSNTGTQYRISAPLYDALSDDDDIVYCFELQTPSTIQLTPTQLKAIVGVNNIWTDSGDITVRYWTH